MKKKSIIIFIIIGIVCLIFLLIKSKFSDENCVGEGGRISTMPLPHDSKNDMQKCCSGLESVPPNDFMSDVHICVKE